MVFDDESREMNRDTVYSKSRLCKDSLSIIELKPKLPGLIADERLVFTSQHVERGSWVFMQGNRITTVPSTNE